MDSFISGATTILFPEKKLTQKKYGAGVAKKIEILYIINEFSFRCLRCMGESSGGSGIIYRFLSFSENNIQSITSTSQTI